MTFPPCVVRDIEVSFTRASCQGGTAHIVADFEPLPGGAPGFEFVDAAEWASAGAGAHPVAVEDQRECGRAAGEGILLTLAGHPEPGAILAPEAVRGFRFTLPLPDAGTATQGTLARALGEGVPLLGETGRPVIAARAVLRRAKHHCLDSLPETFRRAGVRASYDAARRITGLPLGSDPWEHPSLRGEVAARE